MVGRRAWPRRPTTRRVALTELAITPAQVARVIALVAEGTLTNKLARQVVDGVLAGEGSPDDVVAGRALAVVSDDSALTAAVDEALAAQPAVAEKIRDGQDEGRGRDRGRGHEGHPRAGRRGSGAVPGARTGRRLVLGLRNPVAEGDLRYSERLIVTVP